VVGDGDDVQSFLDLYGGEDRCSSLLVTPLDPFRR
jgi:hypothetical protein